jgi:hypothetical protein
MPLQYADKILCGKVRNGTGSGGRGTRRTGL